MTVEPVDPSKLDAGAALPPAPGADELNAPMHDNAVQAPGDDLGALPHNELAAPPHKADGAAP